MGLVSWRLECPQTGEHALSLALSENLRKRSGRCSVMAEPEALLPREGVCVRRFVKAHVQRGGECVKAQRSTHLGAHGMEGHARRTHSCILNTPAMHCASYCMNIICHDGKQPKPGVHAAYSTRLPVYTSPAVSVEWRRVVRKRSSSKLFP